MRLAATTYGIRSAILQKVNGKFCL